MKNIIDWASERARMVLFFVVLSLIAGFYSYFNLPKEGEPDIEIPVVFISVPFQGISAEDSEALLVKPLEKELSELKGLKKIASTAAESVTTAFNVITLAVDTVIDCCYFGLNLYMVIALFNN